MKPNIIFIVADDYGWRDTGCYGSTFYETPALDSLARDGMKFTNAYATCPVCSPSRASLMTGKYPARVGITNFIAYGSGHPAHGLLWDAPYEKGLPERECTLAQALRDGGYQTWHVGKWHLGKEEYYPQHRGFDVNVGGCHHGHPKQGYFAPWGLDNLPEDGIEEGAYLTDHLTDEAIRLMRERDPEKPFFLNFWHYAVHTPIQAPEELIEKYRQKAKRLKLDQVDALVEGETFPCYHKRNQTLKRRVLQSDPAYAALVENMDISIGRVLSEIEELGLADNTIVVYTSDNGGLSSAEGSPTCNLPLNEGKGWAYEGGVREPLLVRWPGHVQAGRVTDAVTTGTDFYPTFMEIAGLPLKPEQHVDGISIRAVLEDSSEGEFNRGAIFWHYPHYGNQGGTPCAAVREGDWKLIRWYEDDHHELYNLASDIGETLECSSEYPEIASRLVKRLGDWLNDVGALLPQPYDGDKPL